MITSEVGGKSREFLMCEALDNWDGGAKGYSARVFRALLANQERRAAREVAVKIARPDRLIHALPVFVEEAEILARLMLAERDELAQKKPGFAWLTPLIEFGWLNSDEGDACLTQEFTCPDAFGLHGQSERYPLAEKDAFVQRLREVERLLQHGQAAPNGVPYLVLKLQPYVRHARKLQEARQQAERNSHTGPLALDGYDVTLRWLFDASFSSTRLLRPPGTMADALEIAIQICGILETAHRCGVQYNDHKLVHYIWRRKERLVYAIDWNVAERLPPKCTENERRTRFCMDLSLFALKVLYTLFIGRVHSGALAGQGPTSTADLNRLKNSLAGGQIDLEFKPEDNQRACQTMQELLGRAIYAGYDDVAKLRMELQQHRDQKNCACFG